MLTTYDLIIDTGFEQIFIGDLNDKEALENFSTNIIVAHNHPTGVLKPSEADIRMTKNIQNAGEILDIKLLDHIIIGENSFYSFAEAGLL